MTLQFSRAVREVNACLRIHRAIKALRHSIRVNELEDPGRIRRGRAQRLPICGLKVIRMLNFVSAIWQTLAAKAIKAGAQREDGQGRGRTVVKTDDHGDRTRGRRAPTVADRISEGVRVGKPGRWGVEDPTGIAH